jgi:hypothetical protein
MYHRNILIEQADPELWAAIQSPRTAARKSTSS